MAFFDSITDIFTGRPAKEAAAKNSALFQQNQTAGTAALEGGQDKAIGALDAAKGAYSPLASKYGAGTNLYLDSLGVNGATGNQRAVDAFRTGPGYDFAVNQALDGVNRGAVAAGGAAGGLSGNTLAALSDRSRNLADLEFGKYQDRLAGLISPELSATSGVAGAEAAKAPIYTGTASNIANLGTNTTNAITGQNTQSANAELAGSGNLLGLGLNLAKLGAGFLPGTSLLGGGSTGNIVLGGAGGPGQFGAF